MKRFLLIIVMLFFVLPGVPETFADDAATLDKAFVLYNSGRFGDAAAALREYVQSRPDPVGYYLLGYSLYKLKKFGEASECFSQAYFIDPSFAPEKMGMPKEPKALKVRKPKRTMRKKAVAPAAGTKQEDKVSAPAAGTAPKAPEVKPAPQPSPQVKPGKPAAGTAPKTPEVKPAPQPSPQVKPGKPASGTTPKAPEVKPAPQPSPQAKPEKPAAGTTTKGPEPKAVVPPPSQPVAAKPAAEKVPPATADKPAPQTQSSPTPSPVQSPPVATAQKPEAQQSPATSTAPQVPAMPPMAVRPAPAVPSPSPLLVSGLLAGFATFFLVIALVFYLYWSFCLFRIAMKRGVSPAWTAWVPIVQIWTFVASAGKPWWWIILLFVPIVNLFVGIHLWMCITEGLGRNKWLGLLMLVPLVNIIFLGLLAFSKTETGGKV